MATDKPRCPNGFWFRNAPKIGQSTFIGSTTSLKHHVGTSTLVKVTHPRWVVVTTKFGSRRCLNFQRAKKTALWFGYGTFTIHGYHGFHMKNARHLIKQQLVGGWTNPYAKIGSSNWIISPRFGLNIKQIFELPPPSNARMSPKKGTHSKQKNIFPSSNFLPHFSGAVCYFFGHTHRIHDL